MGRHAFILGGTGQIGQATAAALLDRGWSVTLASRGGRPAADSLLERGARFVALDRSDPAALAAALRDGADAIIDTVAYAEAHADGLLALQGDVGALVVISSASVYRDAAGRSLGSQGETGFPDFPEPIRETQPTVEPDDVSYAGRKVALEQRLLELARVPVGVLRPCAIHGSHSVHPREWWFVKRMLDGRAAIPLAYRGESRFHTSAVANIAALVAAMLERPGTRILNIGDPEALSVAEIGAAIGARLGYAGVLLRLDVGDANGAAPVGDTPWSCPAPFVLDMQAARALGYQPAATYQDTVAKTCAWLRPMHGRDWKAAFPVLAGYPGDLFDYAAEDRFLAG